MAIVPRMCAVFALLPLLIAAWGCVASKPPRKNEPDRLADRAASKAVPPATIEREPQEDDAGRDTAQLADCDIAGEFNAYGIAAVADDQGWRYVDRSGRLVVVPFVFDNGPDYFVEGLARYVESGRMGFFDERGQRLIPAHYDFAWPFSEGLAAVCTGCWQQKDGEHSRPVGGQWGYIDYLGNEVIPLQYEAAESFAEGRARVRRDGNWESIARPAGLPAWATYRGFLPETIQQHPLLDGPAESAYAQFYLDIGDEPRTRRQIIVRYRTDQAVPAEFGRAMEVTGVTRSISLGGAPATKESYSNEVLRLTGWRYLDEAD